LDKCSNTQGWNSLPPNTLCIKISKQMGESCDLYRVASMRHRFVTVGTLHNGRDIYKNFLLLNLKRNKYLKQILKLWCLNYFKCWYLPLLCFLKGKKTEQWGRWTRMRCPFESIFHISDRFDLTSHIQMTDRSIFIKLIKNISTMWTNSTMTFH
jgi:hypothetical protein